MGFPPFMYANRFRQQADVRRAGGLAARNAGKEFEDLIEISGTGVVELVKIKNFAKRIMNKQREMQIVEERSPFDFVGAVVGTGRLIAFDAKRVGDDASLRVNHEDIVKRHQIEALEGLHRAGGIAGILVNCGRCGDFRWLPADCLRSPKPIRWDAPVWIVLGHNAGLVQMRRLVEIHGGR